jgi:hypothetical protein
MKVLAIILFAMISALSVWPVDLPDSVSSFYDDWNFVVLSSTQAQRNGLSDLRRAHPEARISPEERDLLNAIERIRQTFDRPQGSMPNAMLPASPITSEVLDPVDQLGLFATGTYYDTWSRVGPAWKLTRSHTVATGRGSL